MAFKMAGFSAFTKTKETNLPEEEQSKMTQSKKIYVSGNYKVGDYVNETDFESQFKQKGDKAQDYPQLSVEDYSTVKKDDKGFYVTKLKD